MQQTADRSLRELQRETEQTRAGLTQTVDQLKASVTDTASEIRQRISPESIKAEVRSYVRSKGESMLEDITAAARRNPMQAVAVGASLAYPLFRFARAIPLPVLMVGAGIFFAGTKSGQSITQKASDMASGLSDELGRRSQDMAAQVGEAVSSATGAVSDATGRAGEALSASADQVPATSSMAELNLADRLKDSAAAAGDAINTRVFDIKDSASDLAGSAMDSSRDMAAGVASATRNAASSAANAGLEAARGVRDKAADYSSRAGKTMLDTIQQNPLLVAGVGLLVGGLIASALPKSELEEDLVGDAATAARRRASEAASKGFDAAKGVAGEIFENVARQAGAEGLTPDKLNESAREIGQRVRRVAESAVTTAFDPDKSTHSHTGGGN
ncbi:hypothetical protein JQ634_30595 [Bradyrhizobium sp. AUGA SZCCT0240]|uniref:hypothetical protein n=1 Tax=unclassified Bradyrhizobium TaxID=2631580 RepID=UPI001BA644C8|nr:MULTISPECIES: hypothetical protein [unclassified Bradyrhizobium]MBR1199970.1 hypothetical protein [Bradyrhizobium sp. AUGA SZCCT0158]MBR1244356.1 hypothetical protein [Bradyrhizobium sp. AUGA SZCCT0274]MBR1258019.1 hypothetical protein [Bradyrhizobium sp. AUGA SZCCT0240]